MSREPLVFLSVEPPPSETNDQEADCADVACVIGVKVSASSPSHTTGVSRSVRLLNHQTLSSWSDLHRHPAGYAVKASLCEL